MGGGDTPILSKPPAGVFTSVADLGNKLRKYIRAIEA
jgi:hypothetical protein